MAPFQKTNAAHPIKVVGLGRLELPTSRLSSARSNQLSYKPEAKPTGAGGNPRAKARQTFAEERETKAASSAEWDLKVFDAFGLIVPSSPIRSDRNLMP